MKKIPWKYVVFASLGMVVLVAARSAVSIGKSIYYGYNWYAELAEDPWFYVGIAAAAVGLIALVAMAVQRKKNSRIEE